MESIDREVVTGLRSENTAFTITEKNGQYMHTYVAGTLIF